jgi:Zn-dependent protease
LRKIGVGEQRVDALSNLDIHKIVGLAIQLAVFLFALSIHEASHAWMADRCGDYSARYLGRVTLNPIAHIDLIGTIVFPLLLALSGFPVMGWAKPVPVNLIHLRNRKRDHILISLAGPGSNFLAGCVAILLLIAIKMFSVQGATFVNEMAGNRPLPDQGAILAPIVMILFFGMVINWILAIFNLIPIPPLDGHWIVCELLPANAAAAFESIGSFGFIILYGLMYIGAFGFIFIPINIVCNLLQW